MWKRFFSALTLAFVLALQVVIGVRAVPTLPLTLFGTVKINGENVPQGTLVEGWCGGVQSGSTTTDVDSGNSLYILDVKGDDPDIPEKDGCIADETVTLTIDGLIADQNAIWTSGHSLELDLTAFRPVPAIGLEKHTNGQDADTPPGPGIRVGTTVNWSYIVTNTGNVNLTGVTVSDDHGVTVSCPKTSLIPDEAITCTANGTAQAGQYTNQGTAQGIYESTQVSDSDLSHYFGQEPSLGIEKLTNGQPADAPPGPYIPEGDPVVWTYVVNNTGNVDLTGVTVSDDHEVTVSCPKTSLAAEESMICSANGTAQRGQYQNTGTVTGTPPLGPEVSAQDVSHYFGVYASLSHQKLTQGEDADLAPGPYILENDTVTWTYVVTNTGNVKLTEIAVSDDQGVTIECLEHTLAPNESMTCTASGAAQPDQYTNLGTVTGTPPVGVEVSASDLSHYFGASPSIEVEKRTNGQEADDPPGPILLVGDLVAWTYTVTNTGNITLTEVILVDDNGTPLYGGDDYQCLVGTLGPDEANSTCSTDGSAAVGPYSNRALVTGTPPVGPDVQAEDNSHYFGAEPGVDVEKYTNSQDADGAPGPYIPVGESVTWTYTVTNTGNITLTNVTLVDDKGTPEDSGDDYICNIGLLGPKETHTTCIHNGSAEAEQYSNQAVVTGTPPVGPPVSDSDSSHYFGADLGIHFEKLTNGQDADTAPGPLILIGDPVTWTYQVTNTSNVTLTKITVNDDRIPEVTCPADILVPGQSMTCEAVGAAGEGQYTNQGTTSGTPPGGLSPISDTDLSHYFGVNPGIDLEKHTNGEDADSLPGPYIPIESPVTWNYLVTNTGNVSLAEVTVVDDNGTPGIADDDYSCTIGTLAPDQVDETTCHQSGQASAGQFQNLASVTGTPPVGSEVSDTDPSHYFGSGPAIDLQKMTNGQDADSQPGPYIPVGESVAWTYVITNTGNVDLTAVVVSDDQGVDITCDQTSLAPDETMTCTASGTAVEGQYSNQGAVTATPPGGLEAVADTDSSHYFGARLSVDLQKLTNGQDADHPPGPMIRKDDPVAWTYVITNTSNVALSGLTLVDDQIGPVTCPTDGLAPGESTTCTAAGVAVAGQYVNQGTVTATPPGGLGEISTTDDSHYFGADPSVAMKKLTNGQDADDPPGPYILVGDTVTWAYTITNTGNVALSDVTLVDDNGTPAVPTDDYTCELADPLGADDVDEATCSQSGAAAPGQHENAAYLTALPPVGAPVEASDLSHYFGAIPSIDIEKSTNGQDADARPGPIVLQGDPVEWTYRVENTGNVPLSAISVSDDQGLQVNCPKDELSAGAHMNCSASGTAVPGYYDNWGTVVGFPPGSLAAVSDQDPSHYFGFTPNPSVRLEKHTQGVDADDPPGPYLLIGSQVDWEYEVTNTGNTSLSNILVMDDNGTPEDDGDDLVVCQDISLETTTSHTCTMTGTITLGNYANMGVVTATEEATFQEISDRDPSHYFGSDPHIDLEMLTNGFDADTAPGPAILVGELVTWTYRVTNTGNVTLNGVSIEDELLGSIACGQDILEPMQSTSCEFVGTASAGQYASQGTATGSPPGNLAPVSDTDPSYYFGAVPGIALRKLVQGQEANHPPGVYILVGETVTWTYTVTNTGNVGLAEIALNDDVLGNVPCPQAALESGEAMACQTTSSAASGQQGGAASVQASPPAGPPLQDLDTGYYFGAQPQLALNKYTNQQDADNPPGPYIPIGEPVAWTFAITNTGNVTLTGVTLSDDVLGGIDCPQDELTPAEAMSCQESGFVQPGQYANLGTVSGLPPGGLSQVSATDLSHYFGSGGGIELQTLTNGVDADLPPGPSILVNHPVTWTYTVTNTGNVTLADISLRDDRLGDIPCPETSLAGGESMLCLANGLAAIGQYATIGKVSGNPPSGSPVMDADLSYYFGASPELGLEARTNGLPADQPPGPQLQAGAVVQWTYVVTNTGNVPLTDISVTDDQLREVDCPQTSLKVREWMVCAAQGIVLPGQYANLSQAQGYYAPVDVWVSRQDHSHYFGVAGGSGIYLPLLRR